MRGSRGLVKSIVWMRRIRFLNGRKPLGELACLRRQTMRQCCGGNLPRQKSVAKISVSVTSTARLGSWLTEADQMLAAS